MRKRQGLIIRVLLGWWLFCLAGQCLSLPLYQSLDAGFSGHDAVAMQDHGGSHHDCGGDATVCDEVAFPAFFLVLAAALPFLLWLGHSRLQAVPLRPLVPFRAVATGPPLYLLSQRFLE
jgi:hypothetical protein